MIKQIFCDENGQLSSKRVVGVLGSLSLMIALFIERTDALVWAVAFLAGGALGITTIEKIFKK
jgi:hypothetical protein